ncbi:hypothetical protein Vafri_9646 [Volvox africanus]|uniref:Uncharacterized protein n=1 Tax=Volvox africanus TaxID=51714 RepID=A0A8J4EZ54_9CHLO|nr:hypothetical protein Vafri_9646 [Volvox africanus]
MVRTHIAGRPHISLHCAGATQPSVMSIVTTIFCSNGSPAVPASTWHLLTTRHVRDGMSLRQPHLGAELQHLQAQQLGHVRQARLPDHQARQAGQVRDTLQSL